MGRSNVCVIYDSDEEYAKRLMTIINDDNDIPYNAQVFTEKSELDRFLEDRKVDVLMIDEEAYRTGKTEKEDYDAAEGKLVVLCEDDADAEQIREKPGDTVGVYKYQPSYQILQSVVKVKRKKIEAVGETKIVGIVGSCFGVRMLMALGISHFLSDKTKTLFINMEQFSGIDQIFNTEGKGTLSDALYAFKQNSNQYSKRIAGFISQIGKLDYLAESGCVDDLKDLDEAGFQNFIQTVGRELEYNYIVLELGDGVRDVLGILENCDHIYMAMGKDALDKVRAKNIEKYILEHGHEALIDRINKVVIEDSDRVELDNLWNEIVYSNSYEKISKILQGL